jgi:hypothetical protein
MQLTRIAGKPHLHRLSGGRPCHYCRARRRSSEPSPQAVDERRLFYVAMTRSQKFLHLTWAPVPGNQLFQRRLEFWDDILASKWVKRRAQDYSTRKQLPSIARAGVTNVVFSFSNLKYFFECPYQFKLRILYGFNAPIDEALGYGKSLHDALAEVQPQPIMRSSRSPSRAARTTGAILSGRRPEGHEGYPSSRARPETGVAWPLGCGLCCLTPVPIGGQRATPNDIRLSPSSALRTKQ